MVFQHPFIVTLSEKKNTLEFSGAKFPQSFYIKLNGKIYICTSFCCLWREKIQVSCPKLKKIRISILILQAKYYLLLFQTQKDLDSFAGKNPDWFCYLVLQVLQLTTENTSLNFPPTLVYIRIICGCIGWRKEMLLQFCWAFITLQKYRIIWAQKWYQLPRITKLHLMAQHWKYDKKTCVMSLASCDHA